jgi:hypothetical protein
MSGRVLPFPPADSRQRQRHREVNRTPTRDRCCVLVVLACPAGIPTKAAAQDACLLTPAQLQSATGRAFTEGVAGVEAGSNAPLCHYAEVERPQRRLTIGLLRENPRARFEASQRLLARGGNSIALAGVGDAAYFNGTAAGVLAGDVFIRISNLRRGASQDPEISPDQARALLQAALERTRN